MKTKLPFPTSPYIQKLYDDEIFSYLELSLPTHFVKKDISEEATLLFAYLLKISSMGHLCMEIKEGGIIPRLSLEAHLEEKLRDAMSFLPDHLVEKVEDDQIPTKPFCLWKDRLYLQRNWVLETKVLLEMKKERKPASLFSEEIYMNKLNLLEKEEKLLPTQSNALRKAFFQSPFFLCGGPGTGKTYTARYLLELFITSLQSNTSLHIALAAPTGKAMMHLKEKIAPLFQDKHQFTALTIHSLLGKAKPYLPYDLIFIDEASMIDIKLMASLLEKTSEETRLIFLGDPEQLPPVEAGSIYSDLVSAYPSKTAILEKPMRFEKDEILKFAQAIQRNDIVSFEKLLLTGQDIELVPPCEKKPLLRKLLPHFACPVENLQVQNSFRLLSCLRVGNWGVDTLNQEILDLILKDVSFGDLVRIPIMITENDHVKGLYNGTQGVAICEYRGKKELFISNNDRAFFMKEEGKMVEIPCSNCPKFELGFCLSVHKSQGSEYDHVFLIVPPGSEVFGKEILYTAATRAKKKISLFGSLDTIKEAISRNSQRLSSLNLRRN